MNISQKLLVAEAILFALPATGLLAMAVPMISNPGKESSWAGGAVDLITVVALTAVVGGWVLIVKALRGGAESLRQAHRGWWLAASLGVVLVSAAVVSMLLPPSPEYSPTAMFRERLQDCILGLPLVLILAHLWAEARFRKPAQSS